MNTVNDLNTGNCKTTTTKMAKCF